MFRVDSAWKDMRAGNRRNRKFNMGIFKLHFRQTYQITI